MHVKHIEDAMRFFRPLTKQVIARRARDGGMIAADKSFKLPYGCVKFAYRPIQICTLEQVVRIQFDFISSILTLWID